jgi:hypothetical protein
MANRVHAVMEQVELRPSTATFDQVFADANVQELPPRNDPMLPPRQLCDRAIDSLAGLARDASAGHTPVNASFAGGSPLPPRRTQMRLQPAGTASGFDPLK